MVMPQGEYSSDQCSNRGNEQKFNSHTPKKRIPMSINYTRDGERQNHTISNKMQIHLNDSNEQRQAEINKRIEELNADIEMYKSKIQSMTLNEENLIEISRYEYAIQQSEDEITVLRIKLKKNDLDFQDEIKTTDNKPISDKKSNYDNSKQMINRIRNAFSSLSENVDKYEGTSKLDPEYIYMDEMLVRFMIELDDIDMNGSKALRHERADIIKNIHKYVSILEDKIKTNVTIPRHPTELPLEDDKTSDKTATCSGTSQNKSSNGENSIQYTTSTNEQKTFANTEDNEVKSVKNNENKQDLKNHCLSNDPCEKIRLIEMESLPLFERINNFVGKSKNSEFIYLEDVLENNILLLDEIVGENDHIRHKRKSQINRIQEYLKILENKITTTNSDCIVSDQLLDKKQGTTVKEGPLPPSAQLENNGEQDNTGGCSFDSTIEKFSTLKDDDESSFLMIENDTEDGIRVISNNSIGKFQYSTQNTADLNTEEDSFTYVQYDDRQGGRYAINLLKEISDTVTECIAKVDSFAKNKQVLIKEGDEIKKNLTSCLKSFESMKVNSNEELNKNIKDAKLVIQTQINILNDNLSDIQTKY